MTGEGEGRSDSKRPKSDPLAGRDAGEITEKGMVVEERERGGEKVRKL